MSTLLFSFLGGLLLFVSNPADIDPTGTWKLTMTTPDGQEMVASLTFKDGAFEGDFMMDGEIDVAGSYSMEGDEITIQDDGETSENPCVEPGTYSVVMSDSGMNLTLVEDDCGQRSEVLNGNTLTKM